MLSLYLKSFMSVFTEKTIINKGPPGLSLGKQVTEELRKCFCWAEGQGFYGLSSLSPGAHPRARFVANEALTCPEAPQLEVPYCSHKLAMDNCISACGSWKRRLRAENPRWKKKCLTQIISSCTRGPRLKFPHNCKGPHEKNK